MVKNDVDVIAYAKNNQTDPSEVYYGGTLGRRDSQNERKMATPFWERERERERGET